MAAPATVTAACGRSGSGRAWRWPGPSTPSFPTTATRSRASTSTGSSPRGGTARRDAARTGSRRVAAGPGVLAHRRAGRRVGRRGRRQGDRRTAARCARATSWSPTAQNSRLGRELGTARTAGGPWGWRCAATGVARHDEQWIDSHMDIRDPSGRVVPGYGWIFPLGDGRVNVGVGLLSTDRTWQGVNTTQLKEYFLAQVGTPGGSARRPAGPATGGKLPMGLRSARGSGPTPWSPATPPGPSIPFNGEGIAYGYETGRLAAAAVGEALACRTRRPSGLYAERLQASYGEYFRWRARSSLISEPRSCGVRRGRDAVRLADVAAVEDHGQPDGPTTSARRVGFRALSASPRRARSRACAMLLGNDAAGARA